MKKMILINLLMIGVFLLSSCNIKESNPIFEILKGDWVGKKMVTNVYGTYLEQYNLEFLSTTKLIYCVRSAFNKFCDKFDYQISDSMDFLVENDRIKGGHWYFKIEDEKLNICIFTMENCVLFSRAMTK